MNLRLLKIDSVESGLFPTGIFRLHGPDVKWHAHIILQNPTTQIGLELKSIQNSHPQFLNIINLKPRNLHFSFPVNENSETYLPPYIEKLFAKQADRLGIEIKNYIHPAYLQKDEYGIKMQEVQLMGVVNVTPDSFSDGGKYLEVKNAVSHALRLEEEGAGILDIGGESSRPGATPVSPGEELKRVLPVLSGIRP